jgi:poly-gamma-glutamate synthase PgsB/CapB
LLHNIELYYLLAIFSGIVALLAVEYRQHQKRLRTFPVRIHVNGTRGKSSVTRLIGAGLRAGGLQALTKVTGTYPRIILPNGKEVAVYRKAGANIIEQVKVVKLAQQHRANALVLECMALQPEYQRITEHKMVKATHGVITNVRPDHLDVMGPTVDDVEKAIAGTVPRNATLFTAEQKQHNILKKTCIEMATDINIASGNSVSASEMDGFSYIEHSENVALALDVCHSLGIDRTTALKGMQTARPDAGALQRIRLTYFDKHIVFYNAFAANDPQSSFQIWQRIATDSGFNGRKLLLLNTRQDRLDRARQLIEMISKKLLNHIDLMVLVGDSPAVVEQMAQHKQIPAEKILNLANLAPTEIFERILDVITDKATLVGIGNMGGVGAPFADYLARRGKTS